MNTIALAAVLLLSSEARFEAELDRIRVEQDIPGISAAVSHGDRIFFAGGSGLADIESQLPMTADTPLYCGSLSKVFTAVLALQLIEQGRIGQSDTLADVIDQPWGAAGAISIDQLLSHTSGLDREGPFGYWFSGRFPAIDELREYLGSVSLRTMPGSEAHYSNIGYATLGLLTEAASGQSYGEALESRVLTPLAMTASRTGRPASGLAAGYSPVGRLLPSEQRPFAGVGRRVGDRHRRDYHNANAMTPAFGIQTTAVDLSRLTRFLLGHGSSEVLSLAMRKKIRSRQVGRRGLGLRIGEANGVVVARHGGWFAAHRSHLLLDEHNDLTIVVLTNSDSAAPDEIANRLHALTLNIRGQSKKTE